MASQSSSSDTGFTKKIGFGTHGVENPDWIREAIICGYRHFDCAFLYQNESIIGKGLKKCIDEGLIKRSDIYITSKLPMNGMAPDKVTYFLDKTLKALGCGYLDLYLIHAPFCVKHKGDNKFYPVNPKSGELHIDKKTQLSDTWKKLEKAVDNGKTRAIGVSNFNEEQMKNLIENCRIRPSVSQNETHIYFQQKPLRSFCAEHNLVYQAFAPLGSTKTVEELGYVPIVNDLIINQLALKYRASAAQIALRWHQQLNMIPIVGFDSVDHIRENIHTNHFTIAAEDLAIIEQLDRNERVFYFDKVPGTRGHRYYPF